MNLKKYILGLFGLLAIIAVFDCFSEEIQAAKSLPILDGLVAIQKTATSIRLKWSFCNNFGR